MPMSKGVQEVVVPILTFASEDRAQSTVTARMRRADPWVGPGRGGEPPPYRPAGPGTPKANTRNNEYEGESHDIVDNKGPIFLSHDVYENTGVSWAIPRCS